MPYLYGNKQMTRKGYLRCDHKVHALFAVGLFSVWSEKINQQQILKPRYKALVCISD